MTDNLDFGQHTPTRALELLAELRPEFAYTVLHETSVPIEMEADARVINEQYPPEFAKVWWLRVDCTGKPSMFNPRGPHGYQIRDTHFVPADEASVMTKVISMTGFLSGEFEDADEDAYSPTQRERALEQPHGNLLLNGQNHVPQLLHAVAPSSRVLQDRYRAMQLTDADSIEIDGTAVSKAEALSRHREVKNSLISVASAWRRDEMRQAWLQNNEMHPHHPDTIWKLATAMGSGQWFGQIPTYIPGIGDIVSNENLQFITGLSTHEIITLQMDDVDDHVFLELAANHSFLVRRTWTPTTGFSEFATIDDVVRAFDSDHHDVVREIVVDAYMAETAGDLASQLDSLDSGFNFEGDAPHELGIRDLGLGDA